jgi:hypothetical protein
MTTRSQRSRYSPKFLISNEIDRFVEFRIAEGWVQWRYINTSNWNNLIQLLQETFDDVAPDILISGYATSGTVNSLTNSSLTMTEDMYAGKYAVLHYEDLTNFCPVPDEAIKILSNTTDTFVFDRNSEFVPSAGTKYMIVEPYIPKMSSINAFDISIDPIVIELPKVTYENEREFLDVYIESGGNGNKVYLFPFEGDVVLGSFKAELVVPKEYISLKSHMWQAPHWDVVNAYKNSVKLDVSITTSTPTLGADVQNWTKVIADVWDFQSLPCNGRARRFVIESIGQTWEAIYTSRITRDMLIHVPITVNPDNTGAQIVDFAIGKSTDGGSSWTILDTKMSSMRFQNQNEWDSTTLVTPINLSFGDRLAVFNKNNAVARNFTVEKLNFTILKD